MHPGTRSELALSLSPPTVAARTKLSFMFFGEVLGQTSAFAFPAFVIYTQQWKGVSSWRLLMTSRDFPESVGDSGFLLKDQKEKALWSKAELEELG